MSGYSEVINLTRLTNNHTNVELAFSLQNEVGVDCADGGLCATNVNNLPLPIYAFLSESQVFSPTACCTACVLTISPY